MALLIECRALSIKIHGSLDRMQGSFDRIYGTLLKRPETVSTRAPKVLSFHLFLHTHKNISSVETLSAIAFTHTPRWRWQLYKTHLGFITQNFRRIRLGNHLQAPMAALYTMTSGSILAFFMRSNSPRAGRACSPFSHADIAAEYA